MKNCIVDFRPIVKPKPDRKSIWKNTYMRKKVNHVHASQFSYSDQGEDWEKETWEKETYIAHRNKPLVKEENDSQEGEEYSKACQA